MWTLIIILVLLIPLVAVVLDSRLGQALARRVEGASPDNARLRALEAEVDRLSSELERVQEHAEFVTRLLEERAGGETAGDRREGGSRAVEAPGGSEGSGQGRIGAGGDHGEGRLGAIDGRDD